jgi:hypothetical protein
MSEIDLHHYLVRLNGKKLILELQPGQITNGGFVSSRIVTSDCRENAIIKASAAIKADPELVKFVRNSEDNPYFVSVDDIEEVDEYVELKGFTFYSLGNDNSKKGLLNWIRRRLGLTNIQQIE